MLPNTTDTSGSFFIRLDLSAAFNIVDCSHFLTTFSSLGFCDIILLGFPVLWHLLSVLCLILHLHLTSKCCCCLGLALYSFVSLISLSELSYLFPLLETREVHMKHVYEEQISISNPNLPSEPKTSMSTAYFIYSWTLCEHLKFNMPKI